MQYFLIMAETGILIFSHTGGRARHSDWYENSFIMVVYKKIVLMFSQYFEL